MRHFIAHDFGKLNRIDSSGDRVYETPKGNRYPSVTSVTGLLSKASIMEWRARVGADEANRISGRASSRGTKIHLLCENYILGKPQEIDMFNQEMFQSMVPHLDRIDNVHAVEAKLYSDHLQVAGTVDCIGEYDGCLSVIDYKTSARIKEKTEISGYFIQAAAYSVAFEERTGIPVPKLVVIMGVDNSHPLIFEEKRNTWIGQFKELRQQYYTLNGR